MTNLIPFPDPNAMHRIIGKMFGDLEVRTAVKRDGTVWFVLIDVCNVLGINNNRMVAARLRDNQKADVSITDAMGRERETTIVSESGLYSVILKSRSKKAEPFQTWVEDEVLPSIRAKGNYFAAEAPKDPLANFRDQIPGNLADALMLAGSAMKRADHAEEELKIAKPKAEALDRIAKAEGLMNCTTAAKCIGVRPKFFFKWLSQNGWTYRRAGSKNWLAYQEKIQSGYLDHKLTTQEVDGEERIYQQVMVTAKGITKLTELMGHTAA